MVFKMRTISFGDDFPEEDEIKVFTLYELQVATEYFNPSNIVGKGKFSKVHRGCLANGYIVAVKRLTGEITPDKMIQFHKEIEVGSRLSGHRNLLRLLGYCLKPLLLVYPFMANKSLASSLRENPNLALPWALRKQITLKVARGLAHLHDHADFQIIHRNVTAANILLDDHFEAVIGDFGMALFIHRFSSRYRSEHDAISAHIMMEEPVSGLSSDCTSSTATLCGTIGHVAPEYIMTGVCSEKSDVFGYGIMLFELITGQKAFDISRHSIGDSVMILDWANKLLHNGNLEMLVDPRLQGKYAEPELWRLIQLALQCTSADPRKRPRMSEAVMMLETGRTTFINPGTFHEENFSDRKSNIHLGKLKHFSFQELELATKNFRGKRVLGGGRFGNVYKGKLPDGSLVAVKRLKRYNVAGELQFQCEVLAMHKLPRHPNMLPLLGFCMEKNERLLVYPYMVNGSLASVLRRNPEFYPSITFHMRKQIVVGVAKVLAFMHEDADPQIIHRDVKSTNVLLDDKFQPLLGHYGWAKFTDQEDIHVSSVGGSIGYIAPEYPWTGQAAPKRDVFAFGVTLLEILTGQRAFDFERLGLYNGDVMLHSYVRRLIKEGTMENIVDPKLGGEYDKDEVELYLHVGLLCTNDSPDKRPKMSAVVKLLETARKATLEPDAAEFPQ